MLRLLIMVLTGPALAAPAVETPAAPVAQAERGRWSVGLGLRPEAAALGAGVGTQSMFRFRVLPALSLDTIGRGMLSTAYDDGDPDEFYLALGFGVAWTPEPDLRAWAPRLGVRFTHVHHAVVDSWKDTPFANLGGDSSGGVRHRSGVEAAIGLVAPQWADLWGQGLRWELELTGSALPSSDHFAWTSGLVIGLVLDSIAD